VGDSRPQVHSHHQLNRDNLPPSLLILGDSKASAASSGATKRYQDEFFTRNRLVHSLSIESNDLAVTWVPPIPPLAHSEDKVMYFI
jgi:hypothetical protein